MSASVTVGQLLADDEIVVSICPPAVAEEIATTVAEIGYCGIYVEAKEAPVSEAYSGR